MAVNARVAVVFPSDSLEVLNRIPTFEASFLTLSGRVGIPEGDVNWIDAGLASAMPEIEAMASKVSSAQGSLGRASRS